MHARPLELPTPVFGLAVQPKKRGDEQKVSDVLHKIIAEDPCFRIEHNAQANETVMRGLGEMHLKTVLEKMSSQYKLELDTRPPSIAYRETIAARADGHSRHKKQTGGAGQFGEVFLKVEPLPRGKGFEFVDSVKGGAIPNQFIPAVEKGVRGVLQTGYLAGYPLQDVRVTVYDGKHHAVDSKEVAFVSAGRKAFLDALGKARPIVLEPIVNVADHRARGQDGRRRRRALRPPRPHQGLRRAAPRHGADFGAGAALGARALPGAVKIAHCRARLLQHGVQPLRAGAAAAHAKAGGGPSDPPFKRTDR